jgi:hypothetical protein
VEARQLLTRVGGRAQVKTLDGKTHTYAVQAGLTVAELKAMVSKEE